MEFIRDVPDDEGKYPRKVKAILHANREFSLKCRNVPLQQLKCLKCPIKELPR